MPYHSLAKPQLEVQHGVVYRDGTVKVESHRLLRIARFDGIPLESNESCLPPKQNFWWGTSRECVEWALARA